MVTPNDPSGEPGVQFGPQPRGGLPGGDLSMSQACQPSTSSTITPLAITYSGTDTSDSLTPKDENDHRYVGLVNQAMTCYLNSLLQTLYMTPEFRNAIYEWEYTKSSNQKNETHSIPCQLQKLFLLLQTSDAESLETKELTAAFGWSSNEAYDQHDVQELCRLMFDALEMRWKNSKHSKLIEQLYRGTMEDFVKCLNCKRESVKQDVFLDLPLAVKPFGATEAFQSVEEALEAFTLSEVLEGANQYRCDQCKSKQNAHKGLRITSFPYLLTIQLKRFDFDYTTFNRIKLNDRMSFPDLLDLNRFVYKEEKKNEDEEDTKMDEGSRDMGDDEMHVDDVDGVKPIRVGYGLDEMEASRLLKRGQYVYELFSVMVHQGNAAGGHYFAYIKNMDQGKWFCFNDTRVEIASPEEIERTFGGMQGGWTNSNTNAYMLMYRQIKEGENRNFIRTENLPYHIKGLKDKWAKQEIEKEEQRKYEESLLRIRVHINGVFIPPEISNTPFEICLPRENTVSQLFDEAFKHFTQVFKDRNLVPPSKKSSRLIKCTYSKSMNEPFQSPADMKKRKLQSLISTNYSNKEIYFLYDCKLSNTPCFPLIDPFKHNATCTISLVRIKEKKIEPPFLFPIALDDTILRVREHLGSYMCERDYKDYRIVFERSSDKLELLDNSLALFRDALKSDHIEPCRLYVDAGSSGELTTEDRKKSPTASLMYQIIDRHTYGVNLRIELPSPHELSQHISSSSMDELALSPVPEVSTTQMNIDTPQEVISSSVGVPLESSIESSMHSEDGDDIGGGGGGSSHSLSLCNNTPQMSPVVSESGDVCDSNQSSDMVHQHQLFEKMASISTRRSWTSDCDHPYKDIETESISETIIKSQSSLVSTDIFVIDDINNHIVINVDKRSTVGDLKKWLAHRCGIDVATFGFFVTYGDNSYESNVSDESTIDLSYKTVNKIVMKLRPALKDDEKMVKVYRFEHEEIDRDKWRLLYEVPLSKHSRIDEVKKKCHKLFKEKYQENITIPQIHIRCLKQRRPELGDNEKMDERLGIQWNENIYVHVIPEERLSECSNGEQAIFIRRFRPSTVEVDSIDYVFISPSNALTENDDLKSAISAHSHIPKENIQLITCQSHWDKWPFVKQRIELHESNEWKDTPFGEITQLTERVGHQVIYFKDKNEDKKVLNEEDKKHIRIRDQCQTATTRRKERALRIQMSSFSES